MKIDWSTEDSLPIPPSYYRITTHRRSNMKVYLASPFFNPEQLAVVEMVEETVRGLGHELFSPREGTKLGDTLGKTMEERKKSAEEIYKRNIDAMDWADVMVAVMDGHDAGTMFEVGYYAGKSKPVIGYTSKRKGLNIMLQEAVVAYCIGEGDLNQLLSWEDPVAHGGEYQNFHPEMV